MSEKHKDYYAILGVLRDASQEEIKRAYREAAQRLHPDKNVAPGETEIFLEVQQAYEVLSNPKRRAQYDATLPPEEPSSTIVASRIEYSRPSLVHLAEPQLIYATLEVSPRQKSDHPPRPPFNMCLVLDRSTSMQGEKLDMLKAAAIQVVRSLQADDVFSLVTFSDRAEVLIPAAYPGDIAKLQSRIQMIQTNGGTEILQGLQAALEEVRRGLSPQRINHIILLTDGHTYGDEQACLQLAEEAARLNIGISALGIGGEWNDVFLDVLAGRTGHTGHYISSPQDIQPMLMEKFGTLANMFAEEVLLEFEEQSGIQINYAFRLQPESGAIALENPLRLGPILHDTPLNVLFEFVIQPSAARGTQVILLDGTLKLNLAAHPWPAPRLRLKMEREATEAPRSDPPPASILSALSRLTLYRLQERARQEAEAGHYESATRHLKNLASLLLTQGEKGLARTALLEAENLAQMQALSEEGSKEIKYGTRALLMPARKRSS